LAETVPLEGCRLLGKAKGAFVNVMARAKSEAEFRDRVDKALADIGLVLVQIEECEQFAERRARAKVAAQLLTMERTLHRQPNDIVFGTFHRWVQTDA
jgi:hypothetical protein